VTLKAARWFIVSVGGLLVLLAIVAGAGSRTETLRQLVITTLEDRFDSDVELQSFSVDTFPTVHIAGAGLVLRLKGRTDVPALISIRSFAVDGGLLGLLSRPRRFRLVTLDGLEINIPPGGVKTGGESDAEGQSGADSPIVIDRLESSDALLRLIPRREGKAPREFAIHRLSMDALGRAERMPFEAELTNPLPRGYIRTAGTIGPWRKRSPGETGISGQYTFDKADLSTIKGIGGILTSAGEFGGTLARIAVKGQTSTPDFHLNLSRQPVPLTTEFEAVVDGTDGDTYLNAVNAKLAGTALFAKGAIAGTPGVRGRTVRLHVKIEDGRIEDLLRLAVRTERPLLTGRLALHTDFVLPPGEDDVIDRLALAGEFDLERTTFTDAGVQSKLAGLSQRARGENPTETPESVVSDLEGAFRLRSGTLSFTNLRFGIPGATVQLAGQYNLRTEALAFDGTLRMKATISEAAGGGAKSFFLKVVDPLFREKGAGAVVPIKVRGTPEDPKFGIDVVRAITPK
jgi:hypothetical protein